jgi:hypothetical protein
MGEWRRSIYLVLEYKRFISLVLENEFASLSLLFFCPS